MPTPIQPGNASAFRSEFLSRPAAPPQTTVRLVDGSGYVGGEWFVEPGNEAKMARIRRDFEEARAEEPDAGWRLQTRGTEAGWHDWDARTAAGLGRRPDYGKATRYNVWDKPTGPVGKHTQKLYRCLNCGEKQTIGTNHYGPVYSYCHGCSWKPSFGKAEYAIPMSGRTYRPFEYAGDPEEPGREGRIQEAWNAPPHTAAEALSKEAAQAPRSYKVGQGEDGFWYVFGLPGEEIAEGQVDEAVQTPDTQLNVHRRARNLDLAEQLYRELDAEFQTNDNLREGDAFDTPIGVFICQGVDVLPHDDAAKKAVAEVDDSYRCACGCDQGEHRKGVDGNGYPYYGECSNHPECKEYTRAGQGAVPLDQEHAGRARGD